MRLSCPARELKAAGARPGGGALPEPDRLDTSEKRRFDQGSGKAALKCAELLEML